MDVFLAYSAATASWLTLQAIPLLLTPQTIVTLLSDEPHHITSIETYLSRSLGLVLLTLAAVNILLTGYLPLSSDPKEQDADGNIKDPYAYPTLAVTTAYHALSAFYCYAQMNWGFSFGFGTGLTVSSVLFCMGTWILLFGSEKGRISKRTGADKRTANFPFTNSESARFQKKESRRKRI